MLRFFRKLLHRRGMQQSMEDELAFHREMAEQQGNPIPLGNTTVIAEHGYALWRFNFLENLWRDLVYAARGLRRSPLLVFTALLSLGLGIGVNAAMFSLGVEFLFSEPSVRDASSLVLVRMGGNSHSAHQVLDFLASSRLFAGVTGENEEVISNFNDGRETRPVYSMVIAKNYFTELGAPVQYGRGILPDDPDEVVVLGYQFWRKQFGGDPAIVGRSMNLDGRMCTVVGITPEHFRTLLGFGYTPDVYMPRYLESTILAIYARRQPGMSVAAARAGVETVAKRMDVEMPGPYKYASNIRVQPVAGIARIQAEPDSATVAIFFLFLLALTALVLLIACVNVASLLLARATTRRREIAIRLAIGASRGRLLQQLLADSVVLAILGTGFGLVLAQVSAMLLARIQLPLPLPIRLQIEPDWRLAIYGALLATVAVLASGLLPAWQSLRQSFSPNLHRERKMRLRRALVAAQIAISVIVLTTGFLFLRNLVHSTAISPGFDVVHTLRARVNLPSQGYREPHEQSMLFNTIVDALAALPGVECAAAARTLPFNDASRFGTDIEFPDTHEKRHVLFHWNAVTPDFFRAMSIPFLEGATFSSTDRGQKTVIVNRAFARRYLGNRQAVGTVFEWVANRRIIGVVEGTKTLTLGEEPQPQVYEWLDESDSKRREVEFVMRSAIPPAMQLEPVRSTLHRIEPMAGAEVKTLYSSIGLALLPSQVGALLMGSTGLVGLLLAMIGLYGVMAFSVALRTREIGVRVAIGASRGNIARLLLGDSARMTLAGLGVGLLLAVLLIKPLAMFLVPGLKATDPLNFAVVAIAMLATALAATWGPIRRAFRIDPNSALRED